MQNPLPVIPVDLPHWLRDHCGRLRDKRPHDDVGGAITNLNLNLRRLDMFFMAALADALRCNDDIRIINFTSALVTAGQHLHTHFRQFQPHGDANVLWPLACALQRHESLQIVYLSYNRLRHVAVLGRTLQTNTMLKELHLDFNRIDDDNAAALAEGLALNESLKVLRLGRNQIGDAGAIALAEALRINTSLRQLCLRRNVIRDGTELTRTLEDHNTTLTSLGLDSGVADRAVILARANASGRTALGHEKLSHVYPNLLFRASESNDLDVLYYLLQERPDLVGR